MKQKNDHIDSNFKLDNLSKRQIYSVPEDYFDNLPNIIQSRVINTDRRPSFIWATSLKFALPIIALVLMLVYFGVRINDKHVDVQAMIDEISTEELVTYLTESDITTEELLSLIDLNELDVDGIFDDNIELLKDDEWDDLLEDYPELENEI